MDILGFTGSNRFLSNFYPVDITIDGITYMSSEHYYMSEKTTDEIAKQKIMSAITPAAAKRLGKKVTLRSDWEEKYKNKSMLTALLYKFNVPEMKTKLIETGDSYLEETNHWGDVYWGVCDGAGKNMLGRMLMFIRGRIAD